MKELILILEVIISIILLVLVYLQSGKVKNVGSSIIGTKDIELFENTKYRGYERILHIATIVLIAIFIILPIIYIAL